MENITIPLDYVIIAITFFILWAYIAYNLTKGGISSLKLIETYKK